MVCKMCVMRWGEDPSIKFARFWLQAWFLWWTHCTRHSGFVDLPPFDILDFKPWYYLEGDAPFCEDDDMPLDDFECDDIWHLGIRVVHPAKIPLILRGFGT